MTAYYNEYDPFAAAWLRQLIDAGHIAPGIVDERSIEDVLPDELAGFTQCHFFAGIGVWSHALRRAGWPDDRPVWTGSCPCQPFSAAGKGAGISDERHLWPAFHHLIDQCRPPVVFGEQVASRDGLAWLDLVHADMEGAGYAFGVADLCAAGFGAPHIRQRLFFVADANHGSKHSLLRARKDDPAEDLRCGKVVRLGRQVAGRDKGESGGLADDISVGWEWRENASRPACKDAAERGEGVRYAERCGVDGAAGPTNGHWRDADWLFCRDGKWRPVEPGTFPLVNGAPNRVGRLRGYGNAIVAPVAEAWIRAYL